MRIADFGMCCESTHSEIRNLHSEISYAYHYENQCFITVGSIWGNDSEALDTLSEHKTSFLKISYNAIVKMVLERMAL